MKTLFYILNIICFCILIGCTSSKNRNSNPNIERAQETLDSLYLYYSVDNSYLLRENYPFYENHTVSYLATEQQSNTPNQYSYLWPYSGIFSAVNALFESSRDKKYQALLENRILIGLNEYFDTQRTPQAYTSYITNAPTSDRFYDDNTWLGINFIDLYQLTNERIYLDKAQLLWKFIESGTDSILGGGVYWCEQKKETKHTCSNAPASVLALKLFNTTRDSTYLEQGIKLYEWTKKMLQDSTDYLYFDNVHLDGKKGKAKYSYNSGQMMQAAALLYTYTNDSCYLKEAQNIAKECYEYFFSDFTSPSGEKFKIVKDGNLWFNAILLRGYLELYKIDNDKKYVDTFIKTLSYAWENARDSHGLFNDFTGEKIKEKKWLLTQAAMIEMYSRLASIK